MSVLADWEIKKLAEEQGMIEPFVDHLVNEDKGKKILSYGLSSYGYDIRLSPEQCLIYGKIQAGDCDPKAFDPGILKPAELLKDERGEYFLLPPYGYCLGVSREHLRLPKNVTGIAHGKSTYARSGILVNLTALEAEWEGYITLEISNCTPLFNRIYANEGITQLLFYSGNPCNLTYADRKGKYQNQPAAVILPMV